jgi:hypothetical protein
LPWTPFIQFFDIKSFVKFSKKLAELMEFTLERQKPTYFFVDKMASFRQKKAASLQRFKLVAGLRRN